MIRSILSTDDDDLELVVTDNSDDDELASWVAEMPADRRLRYFRIKGLLSMTGNCNRALELATGEYVTLIGDDDTVLPGCTAACRWAKEHDVDALTPDTSLRYMWPDFRHRIWGMRQAGHVFLDTWPGILTNADPSAEALHCVLRAGQEMGKMVNLYHGIVRRTLLEALKHQTGNYCYGVSPDVYLSLSLSTQAKNQVRYLGPLTLPGSSGKSNSGRAAVREHQGRLWDDPHMKAYQGEEWPRQVPAFFAIETVWAQAALTACRKLRRDDLERQFNYARLYALCFLFHRAFHAETIEAMRAQYGQRPSLRCWLLVGGALLREAWRFGWAMFRRLLMPVPRGYSLEFGPFNDVSKAREAMCNRFPESFLRFPTAFDNRKQRQGTNDRRPNAGEGA